MVLERGREIAQHRIVLGRQRDQVDRIGRHDLLLAPVQILQAHAHVQRRADVQADGQAVQLAHDDVLQAAPHQLLAVLEHLRPDEAGDIVDMQPGAPGLDLRELGADGPAEAVLAGLEHHHVDAVGGAIGEFRALAGLEVEPVAFALLGLGVLHDLGNRDVEDLVAVVGAGEALEHRGDRARIALGHLGLDVDVREHAPGNRVLQAERVDQVLQGVLDRGDACDRAVHRVGADDDVAGGVGEGVEDLPDHVVGMVRGRVGLDARAHVALRPHPGARDHVEDLLAQRDQLLIVHQLRDTADRVAGQPIHHAFDVGLGRGQEKLLEPAHGPVLDVGVLGLVRGLPDQALQLVHQQRVLVQIPDLRVGEECPGVRTRRLVRGGHPDRLIPLLEVVGGAEQLPIERLVEAALDPADIGEDVLARRDLRAPRWCRRRTPPWRRPGSPQARHRPLPPVTRNCRLDIRSSPCDGRSSYGNRRMAASPLGRVLTLQGVGQRERVASRERGLKTMGSARP